MLGSRNIADKDIAKTIALEVHQIWTKAAIPCWRIDEVEKLVLKSMDELASLMKHWSRLKEDSDPLKSYIIGLDQLFDVSHSDLAQ